MGAVKNFRNIVHSANAFWMHDPGADWNIRKIFYKGYKEEKEFDEDFYELEPIYRVQTLIELIAGMIKMDELNEEEIEFYEEKIVDMFDSKYIN